MRCYLTPTPSRPKYRCCFEGRLPDFNLGTHDGASCDPALAAALQRTLQQQSDYSHVLNGRFKGGYITRHYGQPAENIHAVQLELSQATYLQQGAGYQLDSAKLKHLHPQLQQLIETMLAWQPDSQR